MKKQIIIPLLILIFLIFATTLVVLYGKGYRITFKQDVPNLAKTGVLVAESTPNAAQVFIDNHLTTATDNTINLAPGIYDIKIQKEGYFPWEKKLKIDEEIVTKAEARLFPIAPGLASIATTPVINPLLDPSGTKIAYQIASESAVRKNGIFILNMTGSNISVPILTLQSSSTQIVDNTTDNFSTAEFKWSPDGTQILAEITKSPDSTTTYLLNTDRFNESPQDVTAILQNVLDSWTLQKTQKNRSLHTNIKDKMSQLINNNFSILSWSPDETKILYQASTSAQLPLMITPRRLSIDTLSEKRQLTKGNIYIYDTKEDTNKPVPVNLPDACHVSLDECQPLVSWLSDSNHLIYINDKKIIIMDDDGSNNITVYAGPFVDSFAVPWPDTSKIVILTNLNNPDVSPTLYTIGLK